MKKLITLAALLTMSLSAPAMAKVDCAVLAGLAETIMLKRQNGADMVEMIQAINTGEDKNANAIAVELAKIAYEKNRYSTDKNQARAVSEFKNEIAVFCYREMN